MIGPLVQSNYKLIHYLFTYSQSQHAICGCCLFHCLSFICHIDCDVTIRCCNFGQFGIGRSSQKNQTGMNISVKNPNFSVMLQNFQNFSKISKLDYIHLSFIEMHEDVKSLEILAENS